MNIPPTANCGISADKKVSTSANGPFTDSNTASASDDLFYELRITNTGVVALTITDSDLTDANCDNLSAGPARKEQSGGGADASAVTFDPGDTWTWTCNKTALLGNFQPGGTYENTVSAVAHFGTFTTPPATDSVTTTFKGRPTLSTSASDATVGGTISDQATLAGGTSPTGSITFNVYAPSDPNCTTPLNANPITTTTAFTGPGTYTSNSFTTTTVGSYRWRAFYSGDANNDAVSGACGDPGETSTVSKATPTLATNATSSTVGSPIHDVATVSGGFNPTGNVTFVVYGPDDANCSGTATTVSTNNLSGGSATSANFNPPAAGTYRWRATYNGDANNNASRALQRGERDVDGRARTRRRSRRNATNATVGSAITTSRRSSGGFNPTGTVTFRGLRPERRELLGHGHHGQHEQPVGRLGRRRTTSRPTTAGTYRWRATYNGDANNNGVTGACNAAERDVDGQQGHADAGDERAAELDGRLRRSTTSRPSRAASTPTGTVTFVRLRPERRELLGHGHDGQLDRALSGGSATSANFNPPTRGHVPLARDVQRRREQQRGHGPVQRGERDVDGRQGHADPGDRRDATRASASADPRRRDR